MLQTLSQLAFEMHVNDWVVSQDSAELLGPRATALPAPPSSLLVRALNSPTLFVIWAKSDVCLIVF